jgi:hypothetical protein
VEAGCWFRPVKGEDKGRGACLMLCSWSPENELVIRRGISPTMDGRRFDWFRVFRDLGVQGWNIYSLLGRLPDSYQ